jgi:murein DD-endopeptidase MepM/ murein hydrolase activator NlpD
LNSLFACLIVAAFCQGASAELFRLPTGNRALFQPGNEEKFFIGTIGKPWMSGTFGCVRSGGWQMHEGLDIGCIERDKKGEPKDSVTATADGTVAYMNKKSALSNYGNYLLLRHQVDGLEIYSTYAHLREIRPDLKIGSTVKAGDAIATMGRTTNTREGISKERAHVHFELNCFVNDRFSAWHKKAFPGQRNDHAEWNGQNLIGLDPRDILLNAHQAGEKFKLLTWFQSQTELCRVVVLDASFPWLKRYPALIRPNAVAQKEGIAAYELSLNFNGLPFQVIPRAASELKGTAKYRLLSVNEEEYQKNPCRKLVTKRKGRWELANNGIRLLDLLTY